MFYFCSVITNWDISYGLTINFNFMSEEAKTYVFGNDTTSAMLPALMNNGGFGGNGAWWVILLIALLGGRGFGYGNCGDASALIG